MTQARIFPRGFAALAAIGLVVAAASGCTQGQGYAECSAGYYWYSPYGCVPLGYFYGPPYYAYPDFGFNSSTACPHVGAAVGTAGTTARRHGHFPILPRAGVTGSLARTGPAPVTGSLLHQVDPGHHGSGANCWVLYPPGYPVGWGAAAHTTIMR